MTNSKLIINGVKLENIESDFNETGLKLEASYQISGITRGGISLPHEVAASKDKIFEFVFEDNTTWFCEFEKMDDIFPEKAEGNRSINQDFTIPDGLSDNSQASRGIFQKIALKFINIFVKKAVETSVAKLAMKFEEKQLNTKPGLYKLDENFQLKDVNFPKIPSSYFLFIHGTFSSTIGSFGVLQNTEVWKQINLLFPERILAFQHETLSKSPLENVIDLIEKLPNEISLNLISHSRGGLVGDIISKYANGKGFEEIHLKLLQEYGGREADIIAINKLNELFKTRNIKVERFIRVCCPASGTILASNRASNFLNITLNLIGITNPIFSFLKDLLMEVIKSKDNVNALPGLEAQNPDSPFIKILNDQRPGVEMDDNLVVISASARAKINLKGLLIIATRLFYSQRNDLVVNTDSMYLGAKRKKDIQYHFEEDNDIDHVSIFDKVEIQARIITILKTNVEDKIAEFKQFQQTEIPSTDRNINLNAILPNGSIKNEQVTGNKPILILLPGIMGSTLANKEDSLWINYFKILGGELANLNINNKNIVADGIVKSAYKRIYDKLSETYDVVTFFFDWRKDLTETSNGLNAKIENLLKLNQPIKVLAHSMGGVLFRDFIINHDETWQKLNKSNGFKAVYLGTPFRGSVRIASVLMGQDALITKIAKMDLHHTKNNLLEVFNKFPGIFCLMPIDESPDYSSVAVWEEMSDASESPKPPIPSAVQLSNFKNYREKAKAALADSSKIDFSNMVYIAGKGDKTDEKYEIVKSSDGTKTLRFVTTTQGDESVTWATGIPKQLKDLKSVYYAQCVHGELANFPKIFEAITELLANGFTSKLERNPSNLRSRSGVNSSGKDVSFDLTERGLEATILGLGGDIDEADSEKYIDVVISNGDLKYAKYPILSGHFKHDGIVNGEKAIDWNLKGILSIRNELNLYPEDAGTNELFLTSCGEKKSIFDFKGAIIVGLGKIGELSRSTLVHTIESAALRYLLDLNNNGNSTEKIGLSSLLIGCGYGGLSIDASCVSIIRGVHKANAKIKSYFPNNTIQISEIEFIERYEDKAISSFYVLSKSAIDLKILFPKKKINILPGAKRRIVIENTDEWWNRISVIKREKKKETDAPQMTFSLSTKRASEDKRDVSSGTEMLDKLITSFSKDRKWNENIAHTIFELMIPNDFKENLKNKGSIAWILDKDTAKYPWELLKDQNDALPLSINSGMVRQLSSENTRKTINYITENKALVIADPLLEGFVQQLPGAEKEGILAFDILSKNNYKCEKFINSNSLEILTAIFPNKYKIIHLAGHGDFVEDDPMSSGMIIGNRQFLTTAQLTQMSNVPEFVFVNCCYLGGLDDKAESRSQNRNKFAANIGTELIDMGVKAVIAAGWEVNDTRALKFAEIFYDAMFDGYNFGDAVLKARKEIYTFTDNTWGAYQCYGDPFYKFDISQNQQKEELSYSLCEEAENDLVNLRNNLETGNYSHEGVLEQLNIIADAVKKAALKSCLITELEAQIYAEIGEYGLSCNKYEKLLSLEDANFSVKSIERYHNILTKKCVTEYDELVVKYEKEKEKIKNKQKDKEKYSEVDKKKDEEKLKEIEGKIAKASDDLDIAIKNFTVLIGITETAERYSYLGSVYKRKGYVVDNKEAKETYYRAAIENYQKADKIKPDSYPFANWATLEILLSGISTEEIDNQNKKYLTKINHENDFSDFWTLVEKNNIRMVDFIINMKIDKERTEKEAIEIIKDYKEIWKFTGSKGKKLAETEHLKILIDVAKLKNDKIRLEKFTEILVAFSAG